MRKARAERPRRGGVFFVGLVCVSWLAASAATPDAPRDRLRFIAQEECLPHWQSGHDPEPCISVTLVGKGSAADGFVVLADRKGGAHFLLIPTRTISGIESPEVRAHGALNYFESAWRAREVLKLHERAETQQVREATVASEPKLQMTMFTPLSQRIVDRIEAVDVNALTPLQALNLLNDPVFYEAASRDRSIVRFVITVIPETISAIPRSQREKILFALIAQGTRCAVIASYKISQSSSLELMLWIPLRFIS